MHNSLTVSCKIVAVTSDLANVYNPYVYKTCITEVKAQLKLTQVNLGIRDTFIPDWAKLFVSKLYIPVLRSFMIGIMYYTLRYNSEV